VLDIDAGPISRLRRGSWWAMQWERLEEEEDGQGGIKKEAGR